jgi:UDP-3-O-[3-hydroxymyristoyl] N-acetylglucosamine deacetylase
MATRAHSIGGGQRQKTLKRAIPCRGVGLHSGAIVSMLLRPAPADTGIRFLRTDVTDRDPWIAARYDRVVDTRLCTVIGNEAGVRVGTIEHLMAALAGCEIDNAVVEIDAAEVPVMDGSSEPFVFLIDCAGTVEQDAPRRAVAVRRTVTVGDAARGLTLAPADAFSVDFEIDFASAVVARSTIDV